MKKNTYLQEILLSSIMRLKLREFADNYPFHKRRNKNLYPRLCLFMFALIDEGLHQDQLFAPIQFDSEQIRLILGNDRIAIINALIEAKIISTNHIYVKPKLIQLAILESKLSKLTNEGKKELLKADITAIKNDKEYKPSARFFTINPDLLKGDIEAFSVQVTKTLAKKNNVPKNKDLKKAYKNLMSIRVNAKRIDAEIKERLQEGKHLENHKINYDVKGNFFKRIQVWSEEHGEIEILKNVSRKFLKENYGGGDVQLIKNEKTYYFVSLEKFKEVKTINTYYSNKFCLIRWKHLKIFVNREVKPLYLMDGTVEERLIRLHTLLTNTPSFFRKHMTQYKMKLFNLDIKNSQFMFFTHCLTDRTLDNRITAFANIHNYTFNADSSQLFFELCRKGILYEFVANELGKDRPTAKGFCFTVLFDHTRDNEENALIKKLFPEIYSFIVAYKAHHGYKALSTELQYIEAAIIIDSIFFPYLSHLRGCTIHDSFLFNAKEFESMRVIVVRELNKLIGKNKYALKKD